MINRLMISGEKVRDAIKKGEFSSDVLTSAETVAIVMTQDWCPQWLNMQKWIYRLETGKSVDIYELIYNKEPYFKEFMSFKENIWNNHSVPYLRFYNNGSLARETNYISRTEFAGIIG